MSLVISCPSCGLVGEVADDTGGGQTVCPCCQTVIMLPGGPAQPVPPQPPQPAQQASAQPAPSQPTPLPANGEGFNVWLGPRDAAPPPARRGPKIPADEAEANLQWLQNEVQRFNEHINRSMANLHKRRQELATIETKAEAEFIKREQEFNRQKAVVVSRAEAVVKREKAVESREKELAGVAEELKTVEAELRTQTESFVERQAELEAMERRIEELRPTLDDLDAKRKAAEEELRSLDEMRDRFVNRQRELERGERSLQARLAEAEEMEHQLRAEFEARQKDLDRQRKELEAELAKAKIVSNPRNAVVVAWRDRAAAFAERAGTPAAQDGRPVPAESKKS